MLIHFTKSIEALDSIVRRGFLYLHNETGVLGPAAWDAFGIDADDQSDGMICFTELLPNETISHQSKFGKFGVAVAKDWLIKNNAQKVMYVPVGSASYKSLVATLKYLAPKSLWGIPTHNLLEAPETRFRATQALTNMKWAQQAGVSDEYITFLETFEWTQTDRDVAQREWRVRNPKPYRFIGQSERQQQIQLLVNCVSDTNVQDEVEGVLNYTIDGSLQLSCTGRLSLVLQLPKEQIRAMFCPEQDKKLIKLALTNAGLSHIQVIASAND